MIIIRVVNSGRDGRRPQPFIETRHGTAPSGNFASYGVGNIDMLVLAFDLFPDCGPLLDEHIARIQSCDAKVSLDFLNKYEYKRESFVFVK